MEATLLLLYMLAIFLNTWFEKVISYDLSDMKIVYKSILGVTAKLLVRVKAGTMDT